MLEKFMDKDLIFVQDEADGKYELLEQMVDKTLGKGLIMTREPILHEIKKREELESTGVIEGVALPHARTEAVKDLILEISIIKNGLDFEALDGKPVNIVFLIVAPEDARKKYIKVLARISRMCRQEGFRDKLQSAEDAEEVYNIIKDLDSE